MNTDFTIIIQGPLNKISLDNVGNYQKFGQVILSHWKDCQINLLEGIKDVITVNIDWEKTYSNCYNYQSIYRQIISTLAGLKLVKTKFAIKVRSDESYSDLSYFCDTVRKNETRLTTNNVFFRPDRLYKFHPSDHVMGAKVDILIPMFERAREFCSKIKWDSGKLHGYNAGIEGLGFVSAEMILCMCYFLSRNIKIDLKRSKELMKEFLVLVPVSKMGEFVVRSTYFNKTYVTQEQICMDSEDDPSICSMEEL